MANLILTPGCGCGCPSLLCYCPGVGNTITVTPSGPTAYYQEQDCLFVSAPGATNPSWVSPDYAAAFPFGHTLGRYVVSCITAGNYFSLGLNTRPNSSSGYSATYTLGRFNLPATGNECSPFLLTNLTPGAGLVAGNTFQIAE